MQTKVSFADSGLREYCTKYLKRMRPHVSSVVVVYDSAVPEYLLGQATAGVINSGCNMKLIKASRGEKNKTIENAVQLATKLLKAKVDRNSLVLAVGGGVTSDVTGFAASMTLRGVRWACLPTTLLSMVDASIGGKTGVNALGAKNMIGAFYQPKGVYIDTDTLLTLPERELSAGLAEIIKHGVLADSEYFDLIEKDIGQLRQKDEGALISAIKGSCQIKASVVAEDERESGKRAPFELWPYFCPCYRNGNGLRAVVAW